MRKCRNAAISRNVLTQIWKLSLALTSLYVPFNAIAQVEEVCTKELQQQLALDAPFVIDESGFDGDLKELRLNIQNLVKLASMSAFEFRLKIPELIEGELTSHPSHYSFAMHTVDWEDEWFKTAVLSLGKKEDMPIVWEFYTTPAAKAEQFAREFEEEMSPYFCRFDDQGRPEFSFFTREYSFFVKVAREQVEGEENHVLHTVILWKQPIG